MAKLSVERTLRKAISHERNGQMDEARKCYDSILELFPGNIRAKQGLAKLSQPKPGTLAGKNPSDETLNQLIALYNKGQIRTVIQECDRLTKEFPQSFLLWNLLGAANNAQGKLEEAIAAYNKALLIKPDSAEAHSNLGVTLQELGKLEDALVQYKKSFELVRGKNPVDPQHKSFRLISKAKMKHDIEQFEYLAASGYESEKFQALVNVYKAVSSEINWPTNDAEIIPLTDKDQKLLKDTYNRSIHVLEAPELPGPTLSNTLDIEKITENYFKHEFGLTYFDNFLTPVALDSIRHFLLGNTIWFDFFHTGGYMGAYLNDGLACPLFFQIAEEMRTTFPKIFKNHPLKQLWAYKYDSRAYKNDSPFTGINAHADFAAVNVNFWVTPKAANLNSLSGGLVVYNTEAPLEWDFNTFNNDTEKILEHLEDNNDGKSIVPYNENRIVIFNSNLIHETDKFEFKEGYENRRINVTMLFGKRGA